MSEKNLSAGDIRQIFRGQPSVAENGFRHYAVMIPMVVRDDGIHVMYEVRAKDLDRQPGEICFPGGEQEAGETWQECALRETWEEIGIPPESVEMFDELTTIYGAGRFAMHCFPALVDPEAVDQMQISADEVDQVFTVPLQDLIDAECSKCHADLVSEVHELQEKVDARTTEISDMLVELTETLADAVASGEYSEEELDAIRAVARDAQFYWDFVFVENSEGAHNPTLTTACLDKAEALTKQAMDMFKA